MKWWRTLERKAKLENGERKQWSSRLVSTASSRLLIRVKQLRAHVLSLSLNKCAPRRKDTQRGYRFSPGWYCGSVAVKQSSRKDWRYSKVGLSSGSFFQQSFIISCRDSGHPWGQGMRYPRSTCSRTSRFTMPEGETGGGIRCDKRGTAITQWMFSRLLIKLGL